MARVRLRHGRARGHPLLILSFGRCSINTTDKMSHKLSSSSARNTYTAVSHTLSVALTGTYHGLTQYRAVPFFYHLTATL